MAARIVKSAAAADLGGGCGNRGLDFRIGIVQGVDLARFIMGIKNQRGYSLISMMVAMVLLTVGVIALMRTTGEIVEGYGTTSIRTTALSIARGYLEELRTRDPATLVTEAAVTVNGSGVADVNGNFSRSVTVTSPQGNLRQVVVTVNFTRAARPIELVTLVFMSAP